MLHKPRKYHLSAFAIIVLVCWRFAYLPAVSAQSTVVAGITRVAWSHTTNHLASGDGSGRIVVQDGTTGQRLWSIQAHNGAVCSL